MFTLTCDNCKKETKSPFTSGYVEVSVKPINRSNRTTKHLCPECASNPIIANLLGSKKASNTQPVENNNEDSANKEE